MPGCFAQGDGLTNGSSRGAMEARRAALEARGLGGCAVHTFPFYFHFIFSCKKQGGLVGVPFTHAEAHLQCQNAHWQANRQPLLLTKHMLRHSAV
eukprot:1160507-Pelagomonas_calceolata.AAC.5